MNVGRIPVVEGDDRHVIVVIYKVLAVVDVDVALSAFY